MLNWLRQFTEDEIGRRSYTNYAVGEYGDLTYTNVVAERSFWIGLWPGLTTEMLDYVIESIHEFVEKH